MEAPNGLSCRHSLLQILKVLLVPLRQEHVVEQARRHVGRHLTMRAEARRHAFLVVDGSLKYLDQAFATNLVIASRPREQIRDFRFLLTNVTFWPV